MKSLNILLDYKTVKKVISKTYIPINLYSKIKSNLIYSVIQNTRHTYPQKDYFKKQKCRLISNTVVKALKSLFLDGNYSR